MRSHERFLERHAALDLSNANPNAMIPLHLLRFSCALLVSAAFTHRGLASNADATSTPVSIPSTAASLADGGPVFVTRPESQTAYVGSTVTLSAIATGDPTPNYQWRKDGQPLPGRTSSTLTIANVQPSDAGVYVSIATNGGGTAESAAATLTVEPAPVGPFSRILNASVRSTLATAQTLIIGFNVSSGAKPILARAVGPGLARFDVPGFMVDPKLTLFKGPTFIEENDTWGGGAALIDTFLRVGAFALVNNSLDAALVRTVSGGHTVQVFGPAGNVLVELYDAGPGLTPRLTNISARNRVGTGADILIVGLVIEGTAPKSVLIRAVGPGLAGFGVQGVLQDPKIAVFNSSQAKIAENDTWDAGLAGTFASAGAFALPAASKDSALTLSLSPGSYTIQVSGADGGTGEALVEVYELAP